MKALVVFDSNFGNTKVIAQTIAQGLGLDAREVHVSEIKLEELVGLELLVVGSPIIGWKHTENMKAFLDKIASLKGISAAAFDTRVKLFIHGDAAGKMTKKLELLGATIVAEPMFFYVKGKEGPLLDGEMERASTWSKVLKKC